MKKAYLLIPLIILFLLVGLLIWELYPETVQLIDFTYDRELTDKGNRFECKETNALLEGSWKVEIPNHFEKGDWLRVSIYLSNNNYGESNYIDIKNACDVVVEAVLQSNFRVINPGKKIFEVYNFETPLRFEWDLLPYNEEDFNGVVWLFVTENIAEEQSIRHPIFSIPIRSDMISVFGQSPRSFRIIMILILIIGLCIFYISIKKKNG